MQLALSLIADGIAADEPGLDRYGDRLPDQGVDRLGTRRLRHVYNVSGVAWSPNGKLLASCGIYSVRIWNGETGEPVKELKNPPLDLRIGTNGIAWSPDGTRIAASCAQGITRLWDVETETLISEARGHEGNANAVAFSPDGLVYATAGSDGFVRVWDGETGTCLLSLKCGDRVAGFFGLAFSRDGNLLAAGSHKTLRIWSLVDGGEPVKIENAHGENIVSLFFTLDGHLVSAGGSAFQPVRQPDGKVVGRVDPQLRVWDPVTGKQIRDVALENRQGGLCMCTCGVSADGRIAAVVLHGAIEFWDARTWQRLLVADDYRSIDSQVRRGVAVSPDGTRLALTGGGNAVHIRDVSTGKRALSFPDSHEDYLVDVVVSPDGLVAVTGSNDGTVAIRTLDRQTPTTLLKLAEEPETRVTAVGVSPDGKLVAACGWSLNLPRTAIVGHLKLWSRSVGDVLLSQSTGDRIMALAFSPDGSQIALAQGLIGNGPRGNGVTVSLVETKTGKTIAEVAKLHSTIVKLQFSSDGKTLLFVDQAKTLFRWDTSKPGPESVHMKGHGTGNRLLSVAISPDGTRLATSDMLGDTVIIRDAANGTPIHEIQIPGSRGQVLTFSPDGQQLAAGSFSWAIFLRQYDTGIRFFDVGTGDVLHHWALPDLRPGALTFHPNGKRLLAGTAFGTTLVLNVPASIRQGPDRSPREDANR